MTDLKANIRGKSKENIAKELDVSVPRVAQAILKGAKTMGEVREAIDEELKRQSEEAKNQAPEASEIPAEIATDPEDLKLYEQAYAYVRSNATLKALPSAQRVSWIQGFINGANYAKEAIMYQLDQSAKELAKGK